VGLITYAIGDIHGEFQLLQKALEWIEQDSGDDPARVVFLGDYIDRGSRSAHVVLRLMEGPTNPKHEWITLKGNHEDLALNDFTSWMCNGGRETEASYFQLLGSSTIPKDHLNWMEKLSLSFYDDKRFFSHAGINPARTLTEQTFHDLLWSRNDFRHWGSVKPKLMLVHGHTPTKSGPIYSPGVGINLDTAACFRGDLTVAAWRDDLEHPYIFQLNHYAAREKEWADDKWVPRKKEEE